MNLMAVAYVRMQAASEAYSGYCSRLIDQRNANMSLAASVKWVAQENIHRLFGYARGNYNVSTHYTAVPPVTRMRYVDARSADPWNQLGRLASSSNVPPKATTPVVRTNFPSSGRAGPPPSASVRPDLWNPAPAATSPPPPPPMPAGLVTTSPPPPPPMPAGVSTRSPTVWEGATSKFPPPSPPSEATVPPGANADLGGEEAGS